MAGRILVGMEILLLRAAASLGVQSGAVLPALELLSHAVTVASGDISAALLRARPDVVIVDARTDLAAAKGTCRMLRATGTSAGLLVVLTEGGLAAISSDWAADDILVNTAGPAEVEARLRLIAGAKNVEEERPDVVRGGDLVIDPATYSAKLRSRPLNLTYKEFELLRFLAQHAGRVFTREQLLQQVWGFDYFGGTRTVDVHVRRLRAKLGPEHESMIGTVRNVGYRFITPPARPLPNHETVAVS